VAQSNLAPDRQEGINTKLEAFMRRLSLLSVALLATAGSASAQDSNYRGGYISAVTFHEDTVMVMLNVGPTGNCSTSPHTWMQIPATNKAMQGYVTGLWLSGMASQTLVYIYTNPPPSAGAFCTVQQIHPQS
jgi:hypothetical protein